MKFITHNQGNSTVVTLDQNTHPILDRNSFLTANNPYLFSQEGSGPLQVRGVTMGAKTAGYDSLWARQSTSST
jgi:hypothetical protein